MKGLAFLIRALAQVKKGDHPPFKVLVLGRGREAPYRRMAKQMGISEEAVFAGSTNQPEKYYGTADLLVHPTFYDACSLTVLEALASGLPVITTSCNGASGVISHGEEGWVLGEAKDEEGLTTAIRYFFKKERRERALHWRERKGPACSEEANFNRLTEVFKETLQNGPSDLNLGSRGCKPV
jgi:UDP-glucose:(heptosyl)LPS alpha-1,3-glucosyltransferase